MAKEGIPFIILSLILTSIAFWIYPYASIPFGILTFFVVYFFRDPERITPPDASSLVSPADGCVIEIEEVEDCRFLKGPAKKVGIFMSPLNVHVNRAPSDGVVSKVDYRPGKFLIAKREKASDDNERNAVFLKCDWAGHQIAFVQIAGFIARRIVCYVKPGDRLRKGERFGIIRFGSRVDVYLPRDVAVVVKKGDRVKAGESVIAVLEVIHGNQRNN
jgi:phosphatidylserine decarboxylase